MPNLQLSTKKLTDYLDKVNSSFEKENLELLSWMQDRGLKLANLGLTQENRVEETTVEGQVFNKLLNNQTKNDEVKLELSLKEFNIIFDKLKQLLQQPAKQLETDLELYLEQQLSDILGFVVTSTLENHRLNYVTGTMLAEPHLKRFPKDKLEDHDAVLEAGLSKNRSSFGWFINHNQDNNKRKELEKYYLSLQLYQLPSWQTASEELKKWYKFRKMIVINPYEKLAVVGVVGNIDHQFNIKKQFGGSPEVIREAKVWSVKTQGKVLVMFVDDPSNKVPLGLIQLDKLIKEYA